VKTVCELRGDFLNIITVLLAHLQECVKFVENMLQIIYVHHVAEEYVRIVRMEY